MPKNYKLMTMSSAINEAITVAMKIDKKLLCFGLGTTDPKGIFSTTLNLEKKFGSDRVFDVPASENALTGVSIGLGLSKVRTVVTHQRLDFFLLAMDQLVNSAAKWFYTFKQPVPITIRLIVGRGWGQGPTHSQNLHSWFTHIPGIKVVMPSNPNDARKLLLASIFDPNPVIFIEHRWLHEMKGYVKRINKIEKLGKGQIIKKGDKITIVAMSYLVVEAKLAVEHLNNFNINCELIDIRCLQPLDWSLIKKSILKTGRLLVLDTAHKNNSFSSEIIARASSELIKILKSAPQRMAMADIPEPASFGLTKGLYIRPYNIVKELYKILKLKNKIILKTVIKEPRLHDIPGLWFKGPF